MTVEKVTSAARKTKEASPAIRAGLRPEWTSAVAAALQRAVESLDLSETEAWGDLVLLSNNTQIDGIFPFAESAMFSGGRFSVPATIGVTLNYGDKNDAASMTDSFPAEIQFEVLKNHQEPEIVIKNVSVDTSSFYN
jgi:Predicted pPIWI-associating nuclease